MFFKKHFRAPKNKWTVLKGIGILSSPVCENLPVCAAITLEYSLCFSTLNQRIIALTVALTI